MSKYSFEFKLELIKDYLSGKKFRSIKELKEKIIEYISWYNNKKIQQKLNGLSPIEYKQQAA